MFRAIGLMSGTSMDGVDLALIDTDGRDKVIQGPASFLAYSDEDRTLLRQALSLARDLTRANERPAIIAKAEQMITSRHHQALESFFAEFGLDRKSIELIGFHGQTILHRPENKLTIQIGDGQALANHIGIKVIYDFRSADVAAGGQGAPLVPVYHQALVKQALADRREFDLPIGVLNLGGVGNLTYLSSTGSLLSCDTGPGNALIDDLMTERRNLPFDKDGALAAQGKVDQQALAQLMAHDYFTKRPPKSLDRNAFNRQSVAHLSDADAAATLTAFTAASVAALWRFLPEPVNQIIVCGGGARNPTLLQALRIALPGNITLADELGWSGDAMEAQAFAYLAVRSHLGLPLSFPMTTGVPAPQTGGRLAEPLN